MASIQPSIRSEFMRNVDVRQHPEWVRSFPSESRFQQLEDDHVAWTNVTGVLLTIVSFGVMLAVLSVVICLR